MRLSKGVGTGEVVERDRQTDRHREADRQIETGSQRK